MILPFDKDPEIEELISREKQRQEDTLSLVASESLAPAIIRKIGDTILTNRTFEGYPGKRYYAGGMFFDQIETIAIERAKELFGAEHANVQPHCGANTNLSVYHAVLEPGDTILAMNLSAGGHLSHGHPLNISSKVYRVVHYGVDEQTGLIDYDQVADLAREHSPRMIIGGASSYPRLVDWAKLREVADRSSSLVLADVAHTAGLIAAKAVESPVPYADFVTFSCYKTLPGPRGGVILCRKEFASRIDRAVFPGIQGSLNAPLIAAKAACFRIAATETFHSAAAQIISNAKALGEELGRKGFKLVTGGTDTHIVLLDLENRGISGKEAEKALESIGINVNRNVIPFDRRPPWEASGIRLGTTAPTFRGLKEDEMIRIAEIMDLVLNREVQQEELDRLQERVREICKKYPLE